MWASAAGLGLTTIRLTTMKETCNHNPDLRGKTYLVTCQATPIDLYLFFRLTALGAKVVFATPDVEAAECIVKDIRREHWEMLMPEPKLEYYRVDFDNLEEVEGFAVSFMSQYRQLDCIIHNLDYISLDRLPKKQGIDSIQAINYISPAYMTLLLEPILSHTRESRVVHLTSKPGKIGILGYFTPNYDDLFSQEVKDVNFSPKTEYMSSKYNTLAFTKGLQMHYENKNIKTKAVSANSEVPRTMILKNVGFFKYFWRMGTPLWVISSRNYQELAQNLLYASVMPYDQLKGGQYYSNCKEANANYGDWEKLWEKTTNFVRNLNPGNNTLIEQLPSKLNSSLDVALKNTHTELTETKSV